MSSSRGGFFIDRCSGMSVVDSACAITAIRQRLATSAPRTSGRCASMWITTSRATSSAASGTFAEPATGIPIASVYFL